MGNDPETSGRSDEVDWNDVEFEKWIRDTSGVEEYLRKRLLFEIYYETRAK
jgi:hypothetical protein